MSSSVAAHRYLPGVDGLRAVSVLLVLIFHSGLGWLPGGFIGVSVFFTLSGYLITGVLFRELEQHDNVSLARFWSRRIRRLAPAAMTCVAAVCLWVILGDGRSSGPNLRLDAFAAVANVANWRFGWSDTSYAALFSGPSPLLHMWSLAIEEQFYFVFPILIVVLWRIGLRRRGLAGVFVCGALGSGVAAAFTTDDPLAYYATYTRCGEILVGCVLAVLARSRLEVASSRVGQTSATVGGLVGFGCVLAVSRFGSASSETLLHGGLSVMSIASVLLVVAAVVPGPLSRLLGSMPLRRLGQISYGVYLFHWPILLWFRAESRTSVPWFVVASIVTIGLAMLSLRFLEAPIRAGTWPAGKWRAGLSYATAVAFVVLFASGVSVSSAATAFGDQGVLGQASVVTFDPLPGGATAATRATPTRVLVFGSDLTLGARLSRGAEPTAIELVDRSTTQCPALAVTAVQDLSGPRIEADCGRLQWNTAISEIAPDVIVVGLSLMERLPFRVAQDAWVSSDLVDGARRAAALGELIGFLADTGVPAFVYDSMGGERDFVARSLQEQISSRNAVQMISESGIATFAGDITSAGLPGTNQANVPRGQPLRVLVVGDSTAFALAEGFSRASAGVLEVVSAGAIRCPLVHATFTLGGPGLASSTDHCLDFQQDWPGLIQTYDIDVVFAVASLAEQWDQKYAGDDRWHSPGSPKYNAFHDEEMVAMAGMLKKIGVGTASGRRCFRI